MDYEIYHDESKEYGYWHGILLVPTVTKAIIVENLEKARAALASKSPEWRSAVAKKAAETRKFKKELREERREIRKMMENYGFRYVYRQ